jgi:hypothetical protein
MSEKEYAVGENAPELVITECAGDLTVEGWGEPRIVIETGEEPSVKARVGGIIVGLEDDARLIVPFATLLRIDKAEGDVRLRDLEKPLAIEHCAGSLTVRRCATLNIGKVDGDMKVSRLSGDLRVKHIAGDVQIRQSAGSVFLESDGDVSINAPIPEAQLHALGDVKLVLQPKPGSQSNVSAGGVLQCFLQLPASVKVKAITRGSVQVRPPLTATASDSTGCALMVGAGEAELTLITEDSIEIGGWMETENFKEWEADLGRMGVELGAMASEWGRWLDGKLRDKMEDMDRMMKKRVWATENTRSRFRSAWEANPPRSRGASESERMSVLQMLQEGKINVDEADRLLATLEGRRAG